MQERLRSVGPAADQRAGRHHQFSDLRPRPAAARVRREEGQGRSRRAPRPRRRGTAGARRQDIYVSTRTIVVIADDYGVESLAGVMGGEASGCDDATTDVLIESALWDRDQHRADRPQSRDRLRRALSLRARRRSGFRATGAGTRDKAGARALRRRGVDDLLSRARMPTATRVVDFPFSETKRLTGLDIAPDEAAAILDAARLFGRGLRRGPRENNRADMAAGHRGQGRYCRGNSAHPGVDNIVSTPLARAEGVAEPGADDLTKARARGAAGAGGAGAGRGRHLVVRLEQTGARFSAAALLRWRSPTRSPPNSRICGRACCRG